MNNMRDSQILRLLLARDESALRALTDTYGAACRRTAQRILGNAEDAAEVYGTRIIILQRPM